MLQELSIRNFAIIDDLHITFSDGLTILTGETGAGKSIIINAVNLLLGSRVSAGLVRTGADTAELEALFTVRPDSATAQAMAAHDLDITEGLVIRRIISRRDKHRVYVNGRLATAQMLGAMAVNLASISGQHAHQGLLKEDAHLLMLDRFGGLLPLREKVASGYRNILPLIDKLGDLVRRQDHYQEQVDLLNFQKNEIDQVAPVSGEDGDLKKERVRLKHAEMLYQTVHGAIQTLYSGQGAVVEQLASVGKALSRAGEIDADLVPTATLLDDLTIQLEDVTQTLRDYAGQVQTDESRLALLDERMDILNKLKRKYGGDLDAVLSRRQSIEAELAGMEGLADDIDATRGQLDERHRRLAGLALKLSEKRARAAARFAGKVEQELTDLKMADTQFAVSLRPLPAGPKTDPYLMSGDFLLDETGMDRAAFMIAPNVGETAKPLSKIASGGELSRVVLALMAILAETESVGLVVFDEVDAGVGGDVAEMVGKKMVRLARYHQIICITHLPQIAKFGAHHYRIAKQVTNGRTKTTIVPLDDADRIQELARMLGGVSITRATLAHARELLDNE